MVDSPLTPTDIRLRLPPPLLEIAARASFLLQRGADSGWAGVEFSFSVDELLGTILIWGKVFAINVGSAGQHGSHFFNDSLWPDFEVAF